MNIRDLIQIVEQVGTGSKINRSAFLYMDPVEPEDSFAQCSTCWHFLPTKERCALFGKNDQVVADASCGLYVHGEPDDSREIINAVSPENAGYILGQVRCENCSWFNEDSTCGLFQECNKRKDIFDLDESVNPRGCCNGFQG